MSRVVYTNTPATADQEALRKINQVRIVAGAEEGTGLNALPNGVYGYTYSPGLPNAPLFGERRYRSYEIHKLPGGEAFITGFASAADAARIASAREDVSVQIQPEPTETASALVQVPYARIRHHRQYAAPNQDGFPVTLAPARELARH
ncbi:MAG: hypothetical protein FJ202_13030 [Gemmatimonadetes bacterium]|nr:hypothetical protein [Gemmatimonadota bacterium]